jgi:hypothetical protein
MPCHGDRADRCIQEQTTQQEAKPVTQQANSRLPSSVSGDSSQLCALAHDSRSPWLDFPVETCKHNAPTGPVAQPPKEVKALTGSSWSQSLARAVDLTSAGTGVLPSAPG